MYDQNANRRYYLDRGRCPVCVGNPLAPGRKMCEGCLAKRREQYQEKRRKRLAEGVCTRCGRETDGVHKMCRQCQDYVKTWSPYNSRRKKIQREERKEAGKCVVCGVAWAEGGHVMCASCGKKHNESSRLSLARSDREVRRQQMREAGICLDCGKPVDDGEHIYCAKCRTAHADSARKRRIHKRTIALGLVWE